MREDRHQTGINDRRRAHVQSSLSAMRSSRAIKVSASPATMQTIHAGKVRAEHIDGR